MTVGGFGIATPSNAPFAAHGTKFRQQVPEDATPGFKRMAKAATKAYNEAMQKHRNEYDAGMRGTYKFNTHVTVVHHRRILALKVAAVYSWLLCAG